MMWCPKHGWIEGVNVLVTDEGLDTCDRCGAQVYVFLPFMS